MKNLTDTKIDLFDDGCYAEIQYFDDGSMLVIEFNENGSRLCCYSEDQGYYRTFYCGLCNDPSDECTCF